MTTAECSRYGRISIRLEDRIVDLDVQNGQILSRSPDARPGIIPLANPVRGPSELPVTLADNERVGQTIRDVTKFNFAVALKRAVRVDSVDDPVFRS